MRATLLENSMVYYVTTVSTPCYLYPYNFIHIAFYDIKALFHQKNCEQIEKKRVVVEGNNRRKMSTKTLDMFRIQNVLAVIHIESLDNF